MKKFTFFIMGICLVSLLSVPAFAINWSSTVVPTKVVPTKGGVLVYGNFGNPDLCSSNRVGKVFFPDNTTGTGVTREEFLSVVMTAIAANRKVAFGFSGCVTVPWWFGTDTVESVHHWAVMLY